MAYKAAALLAHACSGSRSSPYIKGLFFFVGRCPLTWCWSATIAVTTKTHIETKFVTGSEEYLVSAFCE